MSVSLTRRSHDTMVRATKATTDWIDIEEQLHEAIAGQRLCCWKSGKCPFLKLKFQLGARTQNQTAFWSSGEGSGIGLSSEARRSDVHLSGLSHKESCRTIETADEVPVSSHGLTPMLGFRIPLFMVHRQIVLPSP